MIKKNLYKALHILLLIISIVIIFNWYNLLLKSMVLLSTSLKNTQTLYSSVRFSKNISLYFGNNYRDKMSTSTEFEAALNLGDLLKKS